MAQLDGEALRAEQERLETLWQQLEQANDPIVEHCRLGKYGKLTAAVPGFYLALKHGHYAVDSATAVVFPELADDGLQWLQAACERLALPMAEPRWYLTVAQVK